MKLSKYLVTRFNGKHELNAAQRKYLGVSDTEASLSILVDEEKLDELKQLSRTKLDGMEKEDREVLIASFAERYPGLFPLGQGKY